MFCSIHGMNSPCSSISFASHMRRPISMMLLSIDAVNVRISAATISGVLVFVTSFMLVFFCALCYNQRSRNTPFVSFFCRA